uniref:Uncharacterized protein n=1 Tax=Meloidogyne enterolobii TaxID=390850 RepID=A0A6V7V4X2_MELEN|nr:unnamed protein product [Meloidogyne enterolobii]
MLLKTKLIVVELIDFIMDVRRDFRVTKALSFYKNLLSSCNENGEIKKAPVISKELIEQLSRSVFIDSEKELDMDKYKGQQLLRILLQMTMIEDFPLLTSTALKLLFRHFSQFQELIEDMKQIQLLVSNQDIKNYHQVDRDLFILKQLTEKSELWVHYGTQLEGSSTTSCSSPSNPSQDRSDDDFIHETTLSVPSIETLQEKVSIGLASIVNGEQQQQQKYLKETSTGNESPTTKRRKTLKSIRNSAGILQQQQQSSPQSSIVKSGPAAAIAILQQYYPKLARQQNQLASIGLLLAGSITDNDGIQRNKAEISNTLHSIMEKAPLICYLLVKEIIVRMKDLCFSCAASNYRNQQLLRNMLVYEVILQFLCIPFDRKNDNEMPKLLTLSHEFLRSFCKHNKENQSRLYIHIAPIEGGGGGSSGGGGGGGVGGGNTEQQQRHEGGKLSVETVQDCATIVSIFRGNSELCEHVSEHFIGHIVNLIENKQRNSIFLELLQVIVSSCEKGLDLCQNKVVDEIGKAAEDVRHFYVDSVSFEQLIEMMKKSNISDLDSSHPLRYHIELVRLMAMCTKGKNAVTELKCASLLPMDHIVRVLTSNCCILEVKTVYLQFLLTCYIETDLELKDANNSEYLELILNEIISDIDKLIIKLQSIGGGGEYLNNKLPKEILFLERFVCQIIAEVLIKFFEKTNYAQRAFIDIKHHRKLFITILQKLNKLQNCVFIAAGRRPHNNWYKIADCSERLAKFAKSRFIILPENSLSVPYSNGNENNNITSSTLRTITARQRWQSAIFSARYFRRNKHSKSLHSPLTSLTAGDEPTTVVALYPRLIIELNNYLSPLQNAENAALVEILRLPEKLCSSSSSNSLTSSNKFEPSCHGKFVKSMLIRHCKLLLESKRNELCGRVLVTLYKLVSNLKQEFNENVKEMLGELLCRYFGEGSVQGLTTTFNKSSNFSINNLKENINKVDCIFDAELNPKQEKTLYNMQCDLMDAGAVDLIIDLIVMEPPYDIFKKSIQLAKALLFGGNDKVQMAFYQRLQDDQKLASRFFNALKLKMQAAQNRIKADILSGTSNAGRATTIFSTSGSRRSSAAITPNPQNGVNWLSSIGGETKKHSDLSAKNSLNLNIPFNEQQYFDKRNNVCVTSSNSFQHSSWQSTTYQQQQQQTFLRHQNRSENEEKILIPILPIEISIVEPILRFLQLLCENHNSTLQNFLRTQRGRPDFNLVSETLTFLDCICGSTKGSLGVFAEIGEHNFSLVTQTLISLTEFCQGPCHENQNALARHESNGMDIVISLVLNDIRPLADQRMELALEIKSQASKLLLAIMESRDDSENADRVLRLMAHSGTSTSTSSLSSSSTSGGAKQLIKAIGHAYSMSSTYSPSPSFSSTPGQALEVANHLQQQQQIFTENISENKKGGFKYLISWIWPFSKNNLNKPEICLSSNGNNLKNNNKEEKDKIKDKATTSIPTLVDPKEVGHNIFILAQQLGRHSKELNWHLCPENATNENIKNALTFYQQHTGQIEIVRSDRKMERVLFPINDICGFLTDETKHSVFVNTEKDAQGSKISDFFDKWPNLYNEMKWQRKLQNRQLLSYFTKRLHIWSRTCFFLSVLLNLILAISYPFEHSQNFGQSLFLSADNPFIYLSFLVALLYFFFCCSPEWHSVGLSFCSQISLFLAMFSSSILSTALFGLLPTLWILGTLQFVVKCIHITSYSGNKGFVEDHNWKQIFSDSTFLYHLAYLICCLLGLLIHPFIYSLLLFDVIACEETLQNVIRSVTRNWQSIFLTGLLALILVYHFSIIGYLFFQRDFRLEVHKLTDSEEEIGNKCLNQNNYFYKNYLKGEEENKQKCEEKNNLIEEDDELELKVPSCETLRMCILTTLNWGLRNGGGIGDVLRSVSPHEPYFFWRILYDMTFYIVLIIIVLNLIFGVIIDTFGDLRTEKNEKEFTLRNTCFICGLERGKFDNKSVQVTFDEHNEREHNLWHYIYFIVWLQIKDETEFTGPESFVSKCVKNHNMDWFPRMQAISLQKENENNLEEIENNNIQKQQILQLELNNLREQLQQNQSLLREFGQRMQELHQLLIIDQQQN